jgi:chemotaxis protein methyltransferase CheR
MSTQPVLGVGSVGAVYRISDDEFRRFQDLVQGETGIQLPESKRALLVGRLGRRLRELKLSSFGDYYHLVVDGRDQSERTRMIDRLCTNETYFFREPRHFEFLEREVLARWAAETPAGGRRVRAWSAACATGEEPFSLAMTLLAHLPGWEIEVFASDLSTHALDKARAAVWSIDQSREIPERHLKAYMMRGVGAQRGDMKASPELRRVVRFAQVNLHAPRFAVEGVFDLIFCRNVLIYFSPEGRARVVGRLLHHLAPAGHLFLGHAETINGITDELRSVGPTVYGWAEATPARRAARGGRPRHVPIKQTGERR